MNPRLCAMVYSRQSEYAVCADSRDMSAVLIAEIDTSVSRMYCRDIGECSTRLTVGAGL